MSNPRRRRPLGQALSALLLGVLLLCGGSLRALSHQLEHLDQAGGPGHMWHVLGHPHDAPDGHEHHDHSPDDHEGDDHEHMRLALPRPTRSLTRAGSAENLTAHAPYEDPAPWISAFAAGDSSAASARDAPETPPPRTTGTGTERVLLAGHALRF